MGMIKYWDDLNEMDHLSIYFQIFFTFILTSYLVFLLYFTIFKASKFSERYIGIQNEKRLERLENV